MAEARRMGKSELFSHFADRFEVKRTQAREFFDELTSAGREGAEAIGRVRAARHGEARRAEAEGAHGPQPGDRRGHQDSREDGRQGAHREAVEGHGSPEEVDERAVHSARRSPDPARCAPGLFFRPAASCVDGRALVSGKRSVKVVPTPTSLATLIVPPSCSTIFFEIARPRPEAAPLGRDEVVEDRVEALRRDAAAGVGDLDDRRIAVAQSSGRRRARAAAWPASALMIRLR